MASTTETGHAKNLANFRTLITVVTSFGEEYAPSSPDIQPEALNALHERATAAMQRLRYNFIAHSNAAGDRLVCFAPLRKLCTRILNTLAAAGVQEVRVAQARSINRKIQGQRAPGSTKKGAADDNAGAAVMISPYQTSYDMKAENFGDLIAFLRSVPVYNPNDPTLKIPALEAMLEGLTEANKETGRALAAMNNARNERDALFYHDAGNLYAIVNRVKKAVKARFGASSPQAKMATDLKFRRKPQ